MGLFTNRPEWDDDWTGIPSDPIRPESAAERLEASASMDALSGLGLGAAGPEAGLVESIIIPVAPVLIEPSGAGDALPLDPPDDAQTGT